MFSGITIQFLLILFPIAGFLGLLVYLHTRFSEDGGRQNVLRAAIAYGTYQVLTLEILSLVKGVTALGLSLAWSMLIAAVAIWVILRRRKGLPVRFPVLSWPADWASWMMFTVVLIVLGVTFIVAWVTPPQTWDSLTYHVARIAHWAQNRSIGHYITGIERQNSMSPGAEMLSLGFYVLINSVRLGNMAQWLAMLCSLVAASVVARYLGVNAFGQWLSAAIVATIPIGIVESSSSISDYVAALWTICVVAEMLAYLKNNRTHSLVFVGLAAGLGFLTKPIVIMYLLAFALWLGILLLHRQGVVGVLKWTGAGIALVVLINAGYLTRNYRTYGSFSNPVDFKNHTNQLLTPAGFISNVVKNLGLHAGLPYQPYNEFLELQVLKIHVKLGVDIQDPRTTGDGTFAIMKPITREDLSSNPYHAYLMVITVPFILIFGKKFGTTGVLYTLVSGIAFIAHCGFFRWHIFNGRYHLIFFVLFAPVLALLWGQVRPRAVGVTVGVSLFVLTLPWLLSIDSRPLIPTANSLVKGSILTTSQDRLIFSNLSSENLEERTEVVRHILEHDCSSIGMMLWGDDGEYLFWWLLGTPRNDLRIEWIVSGTPSARYKPSNFQPCAVVCQGCDRSQTIRGNLFDGNYGNIELFLKP